MVCIYQKFKICYSLATLFECLLVFTIVVCELLCSKLLTITLLRSSAGHPFIIRCRGPTACGARSRSYQMSYFIKYWPIFTISARSYNLRSCIFHLTLPDFGPAVSGPLFQVLHFPASHLNKYVTRSCSKAFEEWWNRRFISKLLLSVPMKEFRKSINIWCGCDKKLVTYLLIHLVFFMYLTISWSQNAVFSVFIFAGHDSPSPQPADEVIIAVS